MLLASVNGKLQLSHSFFKSKKLLVRSFQVPRGQLTGVSVAYLLLASEGGGTYLSVRGGESFARPERRKG